MELMLFDFCTWLYLRKLTNIRASFAKDFKLDYKPPPSKNRHAKPDHKEPYSSPYKATITRRKRRTPRKREVRWRKWRTKERQPKPKPRPVKTACPDISAMLR
jgi:hypothetical protein